jgi:hypothetical protein
MGPYFIDLLCISHELCSATVHTAFLLPLSTNL